MQSENSKVRVVKRQWAHGRPIDLSGRRVGSLTVTDSHEARIPKNGKRQRFFWLCNCDCGKSKWVMAQSLLRQTIKSCGCLRLLKSKQYRESLINKTFGAITVIADHSPHPQVRGGSVFCRCECGVEKVIIVDLFKQCAVNSCGCKSGILPTGHAARNIILSRYKKNALIRGKTWDLTDKEALQMMDRACHYCGAPPANKQGNGAYGRFNGEWTYNGIDRKDNDKGYTTENSVPCCGNCNRAKNVQPYTDFIAWIDRLVRYQSRYRMTRRTEPNQDLQLALLIQ